MLGYCPSTVVIQAEQKSYFIFQFANSAYSNSVPLPHWIHIGVLALCLLQCQLVVNCKSKIFLFSETFDNFLRLLYGSVTPQHHSFEVFKLEEKLTWPLIGELEVCFGDIMPLSLDEFHNKWIVVYSVPDEYLPFVSSNSSLRTIDAQQRSEETMSC